MTDTQFLIDAKKANALWVILIKQKEIETVVNTEWINKWVEQFVSS
jgi:hypothetical protein